VSIKELLEIVVGTYGRHLKLSPSLKCFKLLVYKTRFCKYWFEKKTTL